MSTAQQPGSAQQPAPPGTARRARLARPVLPSRRPDWERRYAAGLPLLDLLVLLVASAPAVARAPGDLLAGVAVVAGWLLVLAFSGAYSSRALGFGSDEFKAVLTGSVRTGVLAVVGGFLAGVPLDRGPFLVLVGLGTALLLLGRLLARKVLWLRRNRGESLHRMLVVGDPAAVRAVVAEIGPGSGFRVVGACTPGPGPDPGTPVLGRLEDIAAVVSGGVVDTVAVAGSAGMPQGWVRRLGWQLEGSGIDLMVAPDILDVAGPRVHVRPVATLPMLYLEEPRFGGPARLLKAGTDRLVAAVLLVVLSPVLLLVALAVRLSGPGPVLYRSSRLGLGGQAFTMEKFRSMHDGADRLVADLRAANDSDGQLFKIRQDPRVTPVGRFLRRTSLDELPQLLNVLRGEMSLVGPRPLPLQLEDVVGDERRRLLVKPGITGLWQVSGRSDLGWEEAVRLDLYYVENWSPALDLVILVRTLTTVLRGSGAY